MNEKERSMSLVILHSLRKGQETCLLAAVPLDGNWKERQRKEVTDEQKELKRPSSSDATSSHPCLWHLCRRQRKETNE
jgi:hypothetical protein